jgi:hypothetical protein
MNSIAFPVYTHHGASHDHEVTLTIGQTFTRPNGTIITVISMHEGKLGKTITYSIQGQKNHVTTSIAWFIYNIGLK